MQTELGGAHEPRARPSTEADKADPDYVDGSVSIRSFCSSGQGYSHARQRLKEIERVAKVHRDPFGPILRILEADSPVGEYRKITEEILRFMPDERLYARARRAR